MQKKIENVVIAGGGTAGWMAAAGLSKLLGCNVTLVESDEIAPVGVGEATIPTLATLHRLLQIDEAEFMKAVQGTFKLGISFENWRDVNKDYFHSFGDTGKGCWAAGFQNFWLKGKDKGFSEDYGEYCPELKAAMANRFTISPNEKLNYAYHMDAGLYAGFLRGIAEKHGVKRVEGKIEHVKLDNDSGYINSLVLESGQLVEGDFFLDCTGFRALLIEKALHSGFDDWSHWLPCDSAIAVQTEAVEEPIPYTRSIARESGWQWRIPLQRRVGNGLVYCKRYWSDDEALNVLTSNIQGELITDPKFIKYRTGQRQKYWVKNCVSLGLSSGFIEPLESTSIHLIQQGLIWLMLHFPKNGICDADVTQYNQQLRQEADYIRDFIILHYHVTDRDDSPFWRYCRSMDIPETLRHRIELFKSSARTVRIPDDIFLENSWVQVMFGQGITPESYHSIVDTMSDAELKNFLNGLKSSVAGTVKKLPSHAEFIERYCRAKPM